MSPIESEKTSHPAIFVRMALALICLAGISVFLAAGATASPSRFVYEACDSALPGGNVPGATLKINYGTPYTGGNNCEQPGGSLWLSQTGSTSENFAIWSVPIAVTPGGYLDGMTLSGSACGLTSASIAFAFNQGWPANACVEQQRIYHWSGAYFPSFFIWLGCNQPHATCANNAYGPSIYAHYFAATEVDPSPPAVSNLRGSVLGGTVLRGHQTIGVDAHDKGGGLSRISVTVNGLPGGDSKTLSCSAQEVRNPSVDGLVSATVTPCPADGKAEWTLDTQQYPWHNGTNLVAVCASDYSTEVDPNTTCSPQQSVEVDNTCTGSVVPDGQSLSAQFADGGADSVTVPFDKSVEVAGRLSNEAGDPTAGATICVKMQTLGIDERSTLVDTVKTDAQGRYFYAVPPGPNRELLFGYRHDAKQIARRLSYFAHVGPTLRLKPRRVRNGKKIRMWGELPGPRAGGRVVVLQASGVGSKHWLTFRRATTAVDGHFHASYRFDETPRKTTYRIRALVPNQAGYPWVQGASKAVKVTVTG